MRNKKKKMVARKDEDSALQEAMENVCVVKGLEHKISCHTFKVSDVLDTEGLFFRSKAGRADKQKAANGEAEKQRRLRDYLRGILHKPHDNESHLTLLRGSHEGTTHHACSAHWLGRRCQQPRS